MQISHDLVLPAEAVTQTFAILGMRGVGKTNTGVVFAEEMLKAGYHVVIADPVGVWWGLRSSADGERAGLPIYIFGGDHADVPITPAQGEAVADVVIGGVSAILDLSNFKQGEQTRFMEAFADRLYLKNRAPLHFLVDEADAYMPQRPMPGEQAMLGAMERIVRRGRARGLGMTMISQRAAVINKNTLSQTEVLIALRMSGPNDQSAIDDWLSAHVTKDQRRAVLDSLAGLDIGEAWVSSAGWLREFSRVRIRPRETFDSSATPKVGESRRAATLADVDLATLREQFTATAADAEPGSVDVLRAQIVELKRQIAARPEPQRVEVPVLPGELVERLRDIADDLTITGKDLVSQGQQMLATATEIVQGLRRQPAPAVTAQAPPEPPHLAPARQPSGDGEKLAKAERAILTVLAQFPAGRTKTQIALLTGYAAGGGGFSNAISALRTRGYLSGSQSLLQITDTGRAALGTWEMLPTGAELLDYWVGRLSKAEGLILREVYRDYPRALTKGAIADRTGYEVSGGGFNNALSRLRTLELITRGNEIKASEVFFGR